MEMRKPKQTKRHLSFGPTPHVVQSDGEGGEVRSEEDVNEDLNEAPDKSQHEEDPQWQEFIKLRGT